MNNQLPSVDLLRKLLRYEPDTGKLFWLERELGMFPHARAWKIWNTRFAGKEAFTALDGHGYKHGTIFDKKYKAHRVAYAIHFGRWPVGQVDHENRCRSDNSANNIKDVSHAANMRNCKISKNNTSGVNGVYWDKSCSAWRAEISDKGRKVSLGKFVNIEDAAQARLQAEENLGYASGHAK